MSARSLYSCLLCISSYNLVAFLFLPKLCIPLFGSPLFWTSVTQEFLVPMNSVLISWVTDGCGFGQEQNNRRSYFLGRCVPHGGKKINVQHTLELLKSVIGHCNPIIAKRRDLLNCLSLVYNGDRQTPPGSSKSFQKILTDDRSKQMADAPRYHTGIPPRIATTPARKDPKIF